MTRITVTPTASTDSTEASSRIARALSHVRNVSGRATEKKANAPMNASTRLHRSAIERMDRRSRPTVRGTDSAFVSVAAI
jgi:hypothetical protein